MLRYLLIIFFIALYSSCAQSPDLNNTINLSLIPYPSALESGQGFSSLNSINVANSNSAELKQLMPWIRSLSFFNAHNKDAKEIITIISDKKEVIGSYGLEIKSEKIIITYNGAEGLRNAFSTLNQLYVLNDHRFPKCKIEDAPRFGYRGMHLDVSRHFFSVDEIKKYIDYLTFYKYNTFHWHLTDDQGWRIEIKKYPKLQEIAAFRKETLKGHYNDQPHQFDNKRYGGFYTQAQAREVVAYASARGVEVIPEIEMPGHSLAVLAAYPEFGCEDKVYNVGTKWGVFSEVFCPTEKTFEFLEDVIDEIVPIFSSKYIHVGGDECPKTAWENSPFCQRLIKKEGLKDEHGLQSYFIQRMEKYINNKGKQIIGWDEILEGGLAPNATVMSWRGEKGGIEAANQNHKVIMTPTTHCYFDYYQSENKDEPLAIGGYLPYEKVYHYEVIPDELPADKHKYIWGGQANIWTEYLPTFDLIEYMGLTRMAALSETLWKEKSAKNFDRFNKNLLQHIYYWQGKGVRMANHLFDAKAKIEVRAGKGVFISTVSAFDDAKKYVQLPGSKNFITLDTEAVQCGQDGTYRFYHEFDGKKGRIAEVKFTSHLANKASIKLEEAPHKKYSGSGPASLINGILGSDERYGGSEWLGFNGTDFVATIDLQKIEQLRIMELRFFNGEGQWIYLPSSISIWTSKDGEHFESVVKGLEPTGSRTKVFSVGVVLDDVPCRYLKIEAKNYGIIPSDRQGGGNTAWLFVDEIVVR